MIICGKSDEEVLNAVNEAGIKLIENLTDSMEDDVLTISELDSAVNTFNDSLPAPKDGLDISKIIAFGSQSGIILDPVQVILSTPFAVVYIEDRLQQNLPIIRDELCGQTL